MVYLHPCLAGNIKQLLGEQVSELVVVRGQRVVEVAAFLDEWPLDRPLTADTAAEVQRKVDQWLGAGVLLVWVLYPSTRSAMAYRPDGAVSLLHVDDTLDAESVLPGFSCRVGDLF